MITSLDVKFLLRISIYLAAFLGLTHLITDIWAFGRSVDGIWAGLLNDLYTTGIAVTLLLGLNAIVESLSREGSPAGDTPPTLGIGQKIEETLNNTGDIFRIGVYFVALTGMANMVLHVLTSRGGGPSQIWSTFFFSSFSVVAVVGFLVSVRALVDWFESQGATPQADPNSTDNWQGRLDQTISQPLGLLRHLIDLAAFFGLMYTITSSIEFRNVPPAADLSILTGNLFIVFAVVGFLIAAWNIIHSFDSRGASAGNISVGLPERYGKLERALTTPCSFLLLTTYAVAFLGVIHLVLGVVALRNAGPAAIWRFFLLDTFMMVAAIGFMIGAKALVDWFIGMKLSGQLSFNGVKTGLNKWIEERALPDRASGQGLVRGLSWASLAETRFLLFTGCFLVGGLGILYLLVNLSSLRNTSFPAYLHFFVNNLSRTAAAVFVLAMLVAILDSLRVNRQ